MDFQIDSICFSNINTMAHAEFEILLTNNRFLFKTSPDGIGPGGGLCKHELER